MVFMMRGMGRMRDDRSAEVATGPQTLEQSRVKDEPAQRRELEEEINRLRAEINLRDARRG